MDIVTYGRAMMVRLLYPSIFATSLRRHSGARHSERLNGRVARLFYFPFVKALRTQFLGNAILWITWQIFATRYRTWHVCYDRQRVAAPRPIGESRWAYFPR